MSQPGRSTSERPGILKQEQPMECASPSSLLGLSYSSPKPTPKSVSIGHTEMISPLVLGKQKDVDDLQLENERTPRRLPVKKASTYRLTGRAPISPGLKPVGSELDGASPSDLRSSDDAAHHHFKHMDNLVNQVSAWVKDERNRRSQRKARKHSRKHPTSKQEHPGDEDLVTEEDPESLTRRLSNASEGSDIDFNKLEDILKQALHLGGSRSSRRPAPLKKLHSRKLSTASSDTDYHDGDVLVPSSDVVLDNSKTLAYTGGLPDSSDESEPGELDRVTSYKDIDAWAKFKFEIVRLTHTLRLKGWRKVPFEKSDEISVERLSGALTNAVYVVSPPADLPSYYSHHRGNSESNTPTPKRTPPKLLLRIYGPQVEHLIDRDAELQILRRLARKRIGPRMLGTFGNGRFEEYFHAKPLTPEELRNGDVSRQIAKRMRELHDGIELLEEERDDGAFVWRNWDKWVQRVEQVVLWLDNQIESMPPGTKPTGTEAWKRRGYICGIEWKRFRDTVEKYRSWLDAQYGGSDKIREHLVFCHNDTQYGNILRLVPSGESPLLLPSNSHKQLIVIDFEYSNANLPGLEFANQFTEWCYNYHDARKPYACNTNLYPTPEEQDRFVRAYVRHRPEFNVSTPRLTPMSPAINALGSTDQLKRPSSNISEFMLDARNPYFPNQPNTPTTPAPKYDEAAELAAEDGDVTRLLHETRIWRLANTAQWVAWGIVQAKVPGMPDFGSSNPYGDAGNQFEGPGREELGEEAEEYRRLAEEEQAAEDGKEAEEQEEEFDYLGYAQHRAMFFWGDALQLGIVKEDELPEELRAKVKTVPY